MRQIDTAKLQTRLNTLDHITNGAMSSVVETVINAIIATLPLKNVSKKLYMHIADNLLTACENISKKNIASLCLKNIEKDIIELLQSMDINIDTTNDNWLVMQQALKSLVYAFIGDSAKILHSENPNSEVVAEKIVTPVQEPVKQVKKSSANKGMLDANIADNIKEGGDGVERIPVEGTTCYISPNGIGRKSRYGDSISHNWIPEIVRYYYVPNALPDVRQVYVIKVNGIEQECTSGEIIDGTAWLKYPNITGVDGTQNKTLLANVVRTLATKCSITHGYVAVGWNKVIEDEKERYVYLLENGYGLDGTEYYVTGALEDVKKRHGTSVINLPVEQTTLEKATEMFDYMYKATPNGHQVICISAQFCAYLCDIVRVNTSFFLYSEKTGKEATRLGKSTMQLTACNLTYPTRFFDETHGSFKGTVNSLEMIISKCPSSNCVIDDIVIPPTASANDIKEVARVLEMIVRSNANNQTVRPRLKRNMQLANSNKIDTLPCMNGETLPPVLNSLERRMITLQVNASDINLDMYKSVIDNEIDGTGYITVLTQLGHMALRAIEQERNVNDTMLKYKLTEIKKVYEKQLRQDIVEKLKCELTQQCADMPVIYSNLLMALWALGNYAFNSEVGTKWCTDIYQYVLQALYKQVCRMEGKVINESELDTVLDAIRDILHNGIGHIRQQQDLIITKDYIEKADLHMLIDRLGYKGMPKQGKVTYTAQGVCLGYFVKEYTFIAFDANTLLTKVYDYLQKRDTRLSKQQILDTLKNADIVTLQVVTKIAKKSVRLMHMPIHVLFPVVEGEISNAEDIVIPIENAPSKRIVERSKDAPKNASRDSQEDAEILSI